MNKTKKNIFNSAVKVFSRDGYNGATMDDIALNAGVAKGTLYYYFKSKEDIFRYTIKEGMNFIKDQVELIVDSDEDSLTKFRTLCKVQLNLVYENKDFFKVVMSQLWGKELRHLELRESVDEYFKYLEQYLKRAMDDGVIVKANPSFVAYNLFGILCATAAYEVMNEEKDVNEAIECLVQGILNGIEDSNYKK